MWDSCVLACELEKQEVGSIRLLTLFDSIFRIRLVNALFRLLARTAPTLLTAFCFRQHIGLFHFEWSRLHRNQSLRSTISGLRSAILGAPATPAFDELLNHSPASVHYVFAQFRPPRQPRNYEFGDSMVAISCRAQTGRDVLDTPDVTFGGFLTLSAFPSREILRRSYFWRIRRNGRKLKIIRRRGMEARVCRFLVNSCCPHSAKDAQA